MEASWHNLLPRISLSLALHWDMIYVSISGPLVKQYLIDIIKIWFQWLFLFHSNYRITMYHLSINSISVLHIFWIIPREVGPVEANPYKKLFYLSFDPSTDDDAVTILASFREMKETSKILLPPSPPASFPSFCLHPN